MSKLTFWGRLFCPTIAEQSDCHLKKNGLGDLMESTNMTKMSLWFEGFLFARFLFLGELALCKSPRKITLCQRVTESPIMSDCL